MRRFFRGESGQAGGSQQGDGGDRRRDDGGKGKGKEIFDVVKGNAADSRFSNAVEDLKKIEKREFKRVGDEWGRRALSESDKVTTWESQREYGRGDIAANQRAAIENLAERQDTSLGQLYESFMRNKGDVFKKKNVLQPGNTGRMEDTATHYRQRIQELQASGLQEWDSLAGRLQADRAYYEEQERNFLPVYSPPNV